MRMTDHLAPWQAGHFGEYQLAAVMVAKITDTPLAFWRVVSDTHQISTREAGKSGCAFLIYTFVELDLAIEALRQIHAKMPQVNCELQLMPDGMYDKGDGPASYSQAVWQKEMQYLPERGFSCSLLVDAQNVYRY